MVKNSDVHPMGSESAKQSPNKNKSKSIKKNGWYQQNDEFPFNPYGSSTLDTDTPPKKKHRFPPVEIFPASVAPWEKV